MPTYTDLRQAHLKITLKAWWAGLDRALIALVAALQFMLTALVVMVVYGLSQGLGLLLDAGTDPGLRAAVVAAWQGTSFVLLRTLREAAFMPRARHFFESLPVPRGERLRVDLRLGALCYSFLWVPACWVLVTHGAQALPTLGSLAGLSLCLNIALLRGAWRASLPAAAALVVWTLAGGESLAAAALRVAAVLLGAWALWMSYLPQPVRAATRRRDGSAWQRIALGSGLTVPLLAHELRSNLLARLGFIAASLAACVIVMAVRTNDTSSASVVLFVGAVATLALYSLPALIRRTSLQRLRFIAGHPELTRRMRPVVYGIPTALFAVALAAAWPLDRSAGAGTPALVFGVLYLAGAAAARAGIAAVRWLLPFAVVVAIIIFGAML